MDNKFKASVFSRIRKVQQQKVSSKKWKRRGLVLGGILVGGLLLRGWIVLIILQVLQFMLTPILPNIDDINALYASQSTIIYDREGSELYTIHGDENRFEIPFEKMPESVKLATIASEDDKFYKHPGFDVDGITRAVLGELGFDYIGGGSTITQQFVRNAYLSPERSYWRKLKELLLSLKFENEFTKEEILEMYLNRIPYGSNAYGIQAAAQTFFNKNAEDLTIGESAILAGLPQAPSRYSPYGQNRDLLMGSCGSVEEKEVSEEVSEDLTLKLKATGLVWLRITVDGEIRKETTAEAGEVFEYPFEEGFNIVSGNTSYEVFVNDEEVDNEGETNFSAEASDFENVVKVASIPTCKSIDDENYERGRKDYVLSRMLDLDFITKEEFQSAWEEANNVKFESYREPIKAPHFVFFVRDLLEEKYGKDVVERGGLRVFTTLNSSLQEKAEELIVDAFPHSEDEDGNFIWKANHFTATNASLLSVDNETGQILAMVGSRDYFETLDEEGFGNDGATNLTTRKRQPGSSFKPFAYTASFLNGYYPASVLWDVETNFGGSDDYTPQNYDGTYLGPISIRKALDYSRNIPAVKIAALVGELKIVALAKAMGLESVEDDERYGPTIALGAPEVPMLEMVKGYSVFANGGKKIPFTPILKITDAKGNLIDEFETPEMEDVLESEIAYLTTNILSDSAARPEGWNAYLNLNERPNAAKTGTANKKINEKTIKPGDVWTIGFTPQITTAVWMGNNDGTPMGFNASGLMSAGPIWKSYMEFAHTDLPALPFDKPENIVERSVSKLTGKLVSNSTPLDQIKVETFASYAIPLEADDAFITLEVDSASGLLPTDYTPKSALVSKTFVNIHSERSWDKEWEKPVREWVEKNWGDNISYELPPTTYDNIHTKDSAKYPPSISIVSPQNGSMIQKSSIGVWVDVSGKHGIEKVEYYRDGDLVATANYSPWKGVIPIPLRLSDGDRVEIEARVYDKLYYSDSSKVEVIIGEDTQTPNVSIVSPKTNQEVYQDSTLLLKVDAYDSGGDVDRVSFYLDGKLLKTLNTTPYEYPLIITNLIAKGKHTLRVEVEDTQGYTSSDSRSFEVVEGRGDVEDFAIIYPPKDFQIPLGETRVEVIAQINRNKFEATHVDFFVRNKETSAQSIFAKIDNPSGETFSAIWEGFESGSYEIYFKARDDEGKTIISGRNSIEVK